MLRRMAILMALALLATTAAGATLSGASFTTMSSSSLQASGAPMSVDTLAISSGKNQSAAAGTAVAVAPAVLVTDNNGNPVSGVRVTFAVASGGGSLASADATSDASGIATAGRWTLGTIVGANTVIATGIGIGGPSVTFAATGVAGTATHYSVTSGDYAPPAGGTITLTAQQADAYGNPVRGAVVSVTWSKTGTGGSFAANPTRTDAAGAASAAFTTGTTTGISYVFTASGPGVTGTSPSIVTSAPVATRIVLGSGNSQSATVGSNVTIAPTVLVTDANNNPVPGVSVTFAVASGGGSATSLTATTSASGIAAVGSWRLGTIAGANTLTASSPGLIGSPVTFTATGIVGTATRYVVTSSNYNPVAGAKVTVSAQRADQYGNPVAASAISVAWTKTGTGGTFTATPTNTDASGVATASFTTGTTSNITYLVTATTSGVTGTTAAILTAAGTATRMAISTGNGQSAVVGAAVAIDPTVLVTDANNNPVSGVTVTFAVATGGGSLVDATVVTNASGLAAVTSWTLGTTAGSNTVIATGAGLTGSPLTFAATGVAGAAAKYLVTSSGYAPLRGTKVTVSAQLVDQFGNPVRTSGLSVTWSVTGAGNSFKGNPTSTNSNGIATVQFTTSSGPSTAYVVTATSPGGVTGSTANIVTQ